MPARKLLTERNRELLKNGDILYALIGTATDLETFLFDKLLFEKQIKADLIDRWTLGRYLSWNIKLGLVDEKWNKSLREFVELRNMVAHHRTFIMRLGSDSKLLEKIKKQIVDVLDFLDGNEVKYQLNSKLEKEYGNHLSKKEKFLTKYINNE